MSNKKWRRKTKKTDLGDKVEASPYYHDEVEHPFLDDKGVPVEYMYRPTKELRVDLVAPGVAPWIGASVARLVCSSFHERPEGEPEEFVPCYRDGNVLNCSADNLYWGRPGDPQTAESLAGLPPGSE